MKQHSKSKQNQQVSYLSNENFKIPKYIVLLIVFVRLLLVIVPLNFQYPDQYWQGPEISYKIYNKFLGKNYGFETWEWTMDDPIRNPVYQFILSLGYLISHCIQKILKCLNFNSQKGSQQMIQFSIFIKQMYEYSPKFIQALIAIFGDIYFIKTCSFFFRQKLNYFNVIFVVFNWYYLTMMSRTFINSYECALTISAFYYWILHISNNQQFNRLTSSYDLKCRIIVLLAYVSRPTSLIPWTIFWPYQLLIKILYYYPFFQKDKVKKRSYKSHTWYIPIIGVVVVIIKNIFHIAIMAIFSLLIGSLYFGKFVSTDYNFLKINIIEGWSNLYGVQPFWFYFYFSLPIILGLYLILFLNGLYLKKQQSQTFLMDQFQTIQHESNPKRKQQILCQINANNLYKVLIKFTFILLIIFSFMTHKQTRFIMVVVPFILIICLKGLQNLTQSQKDSSKIKNMNSYSLCKIILLFVIMTVNIFLLVSITTVGKRGGIEILHTIRDQIVQDRANSHDQSYDDKVSIMYLCAGHSLSAFSTLQTQNVILQIPDSSALAMLQGRNQEELLDKDPQNLYHELLSRIRAKQQNSFSKADYVILQYKFSAWTIVDPGRNLPNKGVNIQMNTQYKFFQNQGYQLVQMRSCRNFWQQLIFGYDGFILFRLQRQTKSV